jgi:hypothetical protein
MWPEPSPWNLVRCWLSEIVVKNVDGPVEDIGPAIALDHVRRFRQPQKGSEAFAKYQRQNWWRQRGFRFPDALASDSLEGWLPPVTSTHSPRLS